MIKVVRAVLVLIVVVFALIGIAAGFLLLPADRKGDCFLRVLCSGHTSCAKLMVWLGADPNYMTGGGSAMHYAASIGDVSLMQFLINHDANVNAGAKFGITPLYEARERHQTDAEQFLLKHGANPDTSHIRVP